KAQTRHDPFEVTVGVVELFPTGDRQVPRVTGGRVARRVLDVPPAGAGHVRMRARADAPPVPATPVAEVVSAVAGLVGGEVGDLVPVESRARQCVRELLVAV